MSHGTPVDASIAAAGTAALIRASVSSARASIAKGGVGRSDLIICTARSLTHSHFVQTLTPTSAESDRPRHRLEKRRELWNERLIFDRSLMAKALVTKSSARSSVPRRRAAPP